MKTANKVSKTLYNTSTMLVNCLHLECAESHNFVEVRPVPGPQTSKAGEGQWGDHACDCDTINVEFMDLVNKVSIEFLFQRQQLLI